MITKSTHRVFLGVFFLVSGFSFATWASRIPTIKQYFNFNDAEIGTILLAMPISSLIGLPLSGWLVSQFDSRSPLAVALSMNALSLVMIGFAKNLYLLIVGISLFSFSLRIFNISVNTQSITLQKFFDKKIIGFFHGLWSTGGILGVAFTTFLLNFKVSIQLHFLIVGALNLVVTAIAFPFLLKNDRSENGNKLIISKPDPYITYLGLIVLCGAICEGGMFDWSGIYFHDVIKVKVFTYGYLIFMSCMACSRFVSDWVISQIGMTRNYILSSLLIIMGISLAVIFPNFWIALIGFSLVGWGTASVFPMTFALAGKSSKYSPGMAISIVSTYSTVGMLCGPPLIGYLSQAFHLRWAFITFGLSGFLLIPLSRFFFKHMENLKVPDKSPKI